MLLERKYIYICVNNNNNKTNAFGMTLVNLIKK
jgi:hypothetical protein